MSDEVELEKLPLGVDISGSGAVGAVSGDGYSYTLNIGGSPTVPTEIRVSEDGFVVGGRGPEESTGGRGSVRPISHTGMGEGSDGPLIPLLFQLLRERWATSPELSDVDEGAGQSSDADDEGGISASYEAEHEAFEIIDGEEDGLDESRSSNESEGGSGSREESKYQKDGGEGVRFGPTTVTVPGGYDGSDMTAIKQAASAGGFEDVEVVRSPVAVAATELPVENETVIAIADVGYDGATFAVVVADESGNLSVRGRVNSDEYGRTYLEDRVSECVLREFEKRYGISTELSDDAMERVLEESSRVLNEVDAEGGGEEEVVFEVELSDGVEVTEGGLLTERPLTIEETVSWEDCIHYLEGHLQSIQEDIERLMEESEVDDETDKLILTGVGTKPAPVAVAIRNAFGLQTQEPKVGDRDTAGALGAATLSGIRASGDGDPVVRETCGRDIELLALGESGAEYRRISSAGYSPGGTCRAVLSPASEDQLTGSFELYHRHCMTGDREHAGTYVCSNLTGGTDTISVCVNTREGGLDPEIPEDGVTVRLDGREGRGESGGMEATRIRRDDDTSVSWLAHPDVDSDKLPDRSREDDVRGRDTGLNEERSIKDVEGEDVAKIVWKLRNKLWKTGVKDDENPGISREKLELLFKEYDKGIERHDIKIIDPEIGSRLDGDRHEVTEARESDQGEGTILEVFSLGLAVDEVVVERAKVAAAR